MSLVTKPENPFECVLNCKNCSDSGIIFATNRDEWNSGPYAFRCSCKSGDAKKTSLQSLPLHSRWVPEHVDKRPTPQWLDVMFQKKDYTSDPDFKRRLDIWGREWFAYKLKEWREEQKQKETESGIERNVRSSSVPKHEQEEGQENQN